MVEFRFLLKNILNFRGERQILGDFLYILQGSGVIIARFGHFKSFKTENGASVYFYIFNYFIVNLLILLFQENLIHSHLINSVIKYRCLQSCEYSLIVDKTDNKFRCLIVKIVTQQS